MSIIGMKELSFNDDIVWDTLANGEMDGIEFGSNGEDGESSDKELFLSYVKRIKPRTIEELTVALALASRPWYCLNGENVERILRAFEYKTLDGPFEQLEDTYGYPIFKDQLAIVLRNKLGLDMDQAYELADGMRKRKNTAEETIFSAEEIDKTEKELLWKIAPSIVGRKWLTHYANLIYEACWIVYNGAVKDYYEKNPIKIY